MGCKSAHPRHWALHFECRGAPARVRAGALRITPFPATIEIVGSLQFTKSPRGPTLRFYEKRTKHFCELNDFMSGSKGSENKGSDYEFTALL